MRNATLNVHLVLLTDFLSCVLHWGSPVMASPPSPHHKGPWQLLSVVLIFVQCLDCLSEEIQWCTGSSDLCVVYSYFFHSFNLVHSWYICENFSYKNHNFFHVYQYMANFLTRNIRKMYLAAVWHFCFLSFCPIRIMSTCRRENMSMMISKCNKTIID